jgi:hypothetical protein
MADLPNPQFRYFDITVREIIDLACAHVGIDPFQEETLVVSRAVSFLNEILLSWMNQGIIQYTQRILPVKLKNNMFTYPLPKEIVNVFDILIASFGRQRLGTYLASSGNASLAFDDNMTTSCQQTAPDGYLGIQFKTETSAVDNTFPRIDMVGILSAKKALYELVLEGSVDNINWVPLFENTRKQYYSGILDTTEIVWLRLDAPQPFEYLRIREIGGETLNIAELYFETYINKTKIDTVDRSTYTQLYTPLFNTTPSQVCPQKQNDRIYLSLNGNPQYLKIDQDYGTAGAQNNFLYMRAEQLPFSINYVHATLDLNVRFHSALRKALAAMLASVYAPDKWPMLDAIAKEEFSNTMKFDSDNPKIKFTMPNYSA